MTQRNASLVNQRQPVHPGPALEVVQPTPHPSIQYGYTVCHPLSLFLIGRMFVREPSWEYSANLVGF